MFRQWMMRRLKYNITEYRDTKKRGSRGSITVEAIVFLTLFISFYMMLMSLIQIAKAQIILQYSINEVAKEVSVYSYLLTKTGIVDKRVSTAKQAQEFQSKTQDVVSAIEQVGKSLTGNGNVIGAAKNAGEKVYDYVSDTDELAAGILNSIKTAGADFVSNLVIEGIVKNEVKKQIEVFSNKDADQYLKDLGIAQGLEGLDFSESSWGASSEGGMPVLEVTVIYDIEFKLGMLELEPRTFKLCAKTALW